MPYCFVPGCKSGYGRLVDNTRFFSPPKDKNQFEKWAKAIPRKDTVLSANSKICHIHFSDELIVKSDDFIVNGEKVEIPRVRWKLRPGAVPHIFPNLPKYLSSQIKSREVPNRKKNLDTIRKRRKKIEDGDRTTNGELQGQSSANQNLGHPSALSDAEKTILLLKRRLKNANRNLIRARSSLNSAKARINLLEKQVRNTEAFHSRDTEHLSKKQKMIIDTMLKKCQVKSPNGMRYSNDFILESLLLRIKSPKGFRHCLRHNLLPLPSESHLRKLCKGLKCPYGVNTHSINAISEFFKDEKSDNPRYGVVIFDEVKLREEIQLNSFSHKVDGLVDLGEHTPDAQKNLLANHALVFMFVPFMHNWVQPVAVYASRNATPGDILAKILIQVILQLEEAGARVVGFTCDGSQTNKKAWISLGISGKKGSVQPHILNPADVKRKIWAFSDFVHVLKCIRNHFHDKRELHYNDVINFNFYRELFKEDLSGFAGLRACPKLTVAHLDPSSFQRMNARLAFQLLSNSVAKGMRFYREMGLAGLQGSEDTEAFTSDINIVADALNAFIPSQALRRGSPSHTALVNFLQTVRSTNNTFASNRTLESLMVTLQSTLEMCEWLWERGYKYVLTGKLTQDPLERHFGIMRSFSSDDHPSTVDFLHLHLLQCVYVPIKQALNVGGNCEPKREMILTSYVNQMRMLARNVEMRNKTVKQSVETSIRQKIVIQDAVNIEDWESSVPEFDSAIRNSSIEKCLVYHLAGYVVKHSSKFIKCSLCAHSLRENNQSKFSVLTEIKDYGSSNNEMFLTRPSKSVCDILFQAEKVIQEKLNSKSMWGEIFFDCIDSIENISVEPSGAGCCLQHIMDIIPRLVYHYLKCRFFFRTKEIRRDLQAGTSAKSSRKLSKVQ